MFVGREITSRVGHGARALAKHVEGMAEALGLEFSLGAFQRSFDGVAEDELLAHEMHGGAHGLAQHRLADAGDQP